MNLKLAIFTAWLAAPLSWAQTNYYTVRLDNVYIGEFIFTHELKDGEYEAKLAAETIGFAKAIILASFEGEANGTGAEYRQYLPTRASMDVRTPQYQNSYEMKFEGNILADYANALGETTQLNFSETPDAVDPVTAFAYVFRPLDFDHLCELRVNVVDGIHLRRLVLQDVEQRKDGRWQCKGALERVGGYTQSELTERPYYFFNAVYQRATETEFFLDRMVAETPWGEIEIAYEYEVNFAEAEQTDEEEPDNEEPSEN